MGHGSRCFSHRGSLPFCLPSFPLSFYHPFSPLGLMTASDFVRITSTVAAQTFNIYPRKVMCARGGQAGGRAVLRCCGVARGLQHPHPRKTMHMGLWAAGGRCRVQDHMGIPLSPCAGIPPPLKPYCPSHPHTCRPSLVRAFTQVSPPSPLKPYCPITEAILTPASPPCVCIPSPPPAPEALLLRPS